MTGLACQWVSHIVHGGAGGICALSVAPGFHLSQPCWLAENVTPLPAPLWQAPGKLYHRICVISDILPSEWPPVQTRKGVPHPPPTHMLYRAALARALEPVKEGFKDMLNVAVGSDSRMFRAALVRLVARAAGELQPPLCG